MDEWWLGFVPDPGRWGPLPEEVLGVRDLPAALDAVGLRPGDPVFVRPDFVVDAELLQFALSPDFRDWNGIASELRDRHPLAAVVALAAGCSLAGCDNCGLAGVQAIPRRLSVEPEADRRNEVEPGGSCTDPALPMGEGQPSPGRCGSSRGPIGKCAKLSGVVADSAYLGSVARPGPARSWPRWGAAAGLGRANRTAEHHVRGADAELGPATAGGRRDADVRSADPASSIWTLLPWPGGQRPFTVEA